ncbi:hypothetical protein [Sphingomonas arenae]|uniref:hypothetical protein n=1 Tax=Sphingomonas arenae TaxID=2812555 RepID=UPI001967D394|nr:hypothetical protein [Sphingomonas arenae]
MDNDERIRRWRQGRAAGDTAAVIERPKLRDKAVTTERAETPGSITSDGSDAAASGMASIEEAQLAIVARRQAQWGRLIRRFMLLVAVPLAVILSYILLIATPLYQGEAVFTVQTSSQSAPSPSAGFFTLGSGNSTIADAFKAREFILSRPMMDQLERRTGFMSHFTSTEMDPLTRFKGPFGLNQEPYAYYRKRVRVAVDVQEGILRLYVQARTPEDATRFGNAILASAEAHVNAFSQKISDDQIEALTQDTQAAERQVADARRSLAMVQARRGELSPEQTTTAVYQLISNLELQLAEAQRERNGLLDQGLTESPLLPRLNARVEELRAQIAEQRRRLVSPAGGSLQRTLNEYEGAQVRKEIAQARWESTLTTLQQAYQRILDQRRYFVIVVGMSVATFPAVRDLLGITGPILLALALAYGLFFVARRSGVGAGLGSRAWTLR